MPRSLPQLKRCAHGCQPRDAFCGLHAHAHPPTNTKFSPVATMSSPLPSARASASEKEKLPSPTSRIFWPRRNPPGTARDAPDVVVRSTASVVAPAAAAVTAGANAALTCRSAMVIPLLRCSTDDRPQKSGKQKASAAGGKFAGLLRASSSRGCVGPHDCTRSSKIDQLPALYRLAKDLHANTKHSANRSAMSCAREPSMASGPTHLSWALTSDRAAPPSTPRARACEWRRPVGPLASPYGGGGGCKGERSMAPRGAGEGSQRCCFHAQPSGLTRPERHH